jgi:hypothetical protein
VVEQAEDAQSFQSTVFIQRQGGAIMWLSCQ